MSADVAGPVVEVAAPAKVNLSLHVLARRPDGYHEVVTILQAIDLCDTIRACATGGAGITLEATGPDVGPEGENLAVRAAERYLSAVRPGRGVRLTLTKRIPAGAGLGGGSSDAAATLRALELLFAQPLPASERHAIAAALGSDVAFFLGPAARALGRGRGERLEPLAPLPPAGLVLGMPTVHVSTGRAYGLLAEYRQGAPAGLRHPPHGSAVDDVSTALHEAGPHDVTATPASPITWQHTALQAVNDFEIVIPDAFPRVARARQAVAEAGNPLFAMLSGSGGAVFAVHPTRRAAEDAAAAASRRLPSCPFVAASTLLRIPDPRSVGTNADEAADAGPQRPDER